jgi:hypothetical protein
LTKNSSEKILRQTKQVITLRPMEMITVLIENKQMSFAEKAISVDERNPAKI